MPEYELRVSASVRRTLQRLPEYAAASVVERMTGPSLENPQRMGKPLGLGLEGFWSARVGVYRIVYRIVEEGRVVRVERVNHRVDVYPPR